MIYYIRKMPANFTTLYDHDVWRVMKVLEAGEEYLIATFRQENQARWCLSSLHHSLEARRDDSMVFEEVL